MTYLDIALLGIVAVSGLVAMYRGFTREVLSIMSWAAAAGAAFYFVFYQRQLAEELARQFSDPIQQMHMVIAQVALGAAVFLVVLIIVHLVTAHISDSVLDSRVGAIDRILGFLFGVARGFILVVIPYMFAVSFVCKDGAVRALAEGCHAEELPSWIEKAQSEPMLRRTGSTLFDVLHRFVPPSVSSG